MKLHRILFPTDFSASAEAALAHALFYAEQHEAELHILHSICWHEPETIMSSMRNNAQVMIEEAVARHTEEKKGDRFQVIKRTVVGNATANNILDYAKEQDVDLIVMGTHGRGLRHFLLGSVADEVARLAPCPVVTVRASAEHVKAGAPKTILVPFDFCAQSGYAVAHARELAAAYEAKIILLNVISDYYYTNELSGAAVSIRDLVPDVEKQHIALMELNVNKIHGPKVPLECKAEMGAPVEAITKLAEENAVDLIVMGTHGRSGVSHLILGSTTERVIRLAPCPVYSLKTMPVESIC